MSALLQHGVSTSLGGWWWLFDDGVCAGGDGGFGVVVDPFSMWLVFEQ